MGLEAIQLEGVTFSYPGQPAPVLRELSATVEQGAFVVVCGPSGSGKTTLLRQIKREITPHGLRRGRISIMGQEQEQIDASTAAQRVGFVVQDPENQLVTDTVWQELAFGLENLGVASPEIRRRVAEMAHFFGMGPWFSQSVQALSGGQKQMLNLAAVMVMRPDILLLDEPTSQLDPIAAQTFLQMLGRIRAELGTTVVISEHRLEDVLPMATQVWYMEEGRLAFDGPVQPWLQWLRQRTDAAFVSALPAAAQLALHAGTDGPWPISVQQGQRWMRTHAGVMHPHPAAHPAVTPDVGPSICAKDVWFQYEKHGAMVLKGFCFDARPGEIHAVVGGNGSGKSTALRLLAQVWKPMHGKVRVQGRIAMLNQDPKTMFVGDTIYEDWQETARISGATEAEIGEQARRWGLEKLLMRHPYDVSGGEMQRAALGKLCLLRPDVWLLDEPTKGMDPLNKKDMAYRLRALAREGKTVVLVTHDVDFAAFAADRCSMMFEGEILCTEPVRAFFTGNQFYTTAVHRMTRAYWPDCMTVADCVGERT